jgi:hypothetical protein
MKAIIQHNFTSGLGDFFSDVSHYLTIFKELKESGYEIHLKISLKGNKYTNGPFFTKLFDEETVNFFDSIEESNITVTGLEYEDCKYYSSNHSPQLPGYHHFDVFFDIVPEKFNFIRCDAQNSYSNNLPPITLPKLNKIVLDKIDSFSAKLPEDYSFLHIRTSDIIDSGTERYDRIINNVKNYIEETNCVFHLGTNNKHIYNNLKNYKNVVVYDFPNYDLVNNDMNAFTNNYAAGNISNEVLTERMVNICSEMCSIKNSSKIYLIHDVSWISNFLFYAISTTNNKIELINKNIWSN